MSILNSEACCSLSRLYTYKHPPKFKIWWLAIHRPELSSHLVQYAWILLTLIWSTMGLELSLSLLLTCGTTYLTTSVYVTIKYIYNSFKIFLRFWLAKSTRIIHHNHLLMTKFGRILQLINGWRQKCSTSANYCSVNQEDLGTRLSCFGCENKNGGHFTCFKSTN